MENKICIYHANCNDGKGAALAIYRRYGDQVTYIPCHYGDEIPADIDGSRLYIVDFSFKRDDMKTICRRARFVTVIDHHKTAEKELAGLNDEITNLDLIYNNERSGAALAWQYFFGSVPEIIRHIEDRDLWRFELPDTKHIHYALGLHDDWKDWLTLYQGIKK